MRKLSYWAKLNPWKARIIIIIAHILLMLLAWYTGNALNEMNFSLPGILLLLFILYYIAAAILYPSKNEKQTFRGKAVYLRQKFCDFSLAASAYGMVVCIAGNPNAPYEFFQTSGGSSASTIAATEPPSAAQILESLKTRDKSTLTRTEKKILKKEFKIQLKKYAVAKIKGDKKGAGEAGLIILAIVAAVGLLYLLAVLACNLSCNGNEGAALIVTIFGTAGIILGLFFVIKSIKKRGEPRELKTKEGG